MLKGTAHIPYNWDAHQKREAKKQRETTAKVEAVKVLTDCQNKESC